MRDERIGLALGGDTIVAGYARLAANGGSIVNESRDPCGE